MKARGPMLRQEGRPDRRMSANRHRCQEEHSGQGVRKEEMQLNRLVRRIWPVCRDVRVKREMADVRYRREQEMADVHRRQGQEMADVHRRQWREMPVARCRQQTADVRCRQMVQSMYAEQRAV